MEHDILISLAAVTHFWACGFPDMIEFECTLPYTKVSACCGNISCEHFVSIDRGPLYRPIEETVQLIVHLWHSAGFVCSRVWMKECAQRERNTSLDKEAEREKKIPKKKSSKVPKKKMPAVVGLDVLSRAELSPLTSSSVAAHVGSSQSRVFFLFCHEDGSSWQIKCSFTESWEEV